MLDIHEHVCNFSVRSCNEVRCALGSGLELAAERVPQKKPWRDLYLRGWVASQFYLSVDLSYRLLGRLRFKGQSTFQICLLFLLYKFRFLQRRGRFFLCNRVTL